MKGICISQINSMQSSGGARSLGSSFKKPLHILFKSGPVWSVIRQTDNDQKVGPAGHSRAGRCNALIPNTHTHTHTHTHTKHRTACAGSSNWLLMVYEMFSKGFIIVVVVVVAFIAFIILMEGSACEHWFSSKPPGSANMLLFNQRKKTSKMVQRCEIVATC